VFYIFGGEILSKATTSKVSKASRKKDFHLFLMALPGVAWFIIFKYIPMGGLLLAFKDFKISPDGFLASFMSSEWVGLENFKFLFMTNDAYIITRNTVVYNVIWIALNLVLSVALAIGLNEIHNKKLSKVYQTGMIFPFFLSWVVASYFVFAFLSVDKGVVNKVLKHFGHEPIMWYMEPKYWPFILTIMNMWKGLGYSAVFYLAAICGIDTSYYEAAMIDGATKWEQIKYITLPLLSPVMTTLTLLAVGRIFYADFGLFYNVPRESGALFNATNVIDTYVYRSFRQLGDVGMSSAAGFYQSIIGFILVLASNKIVKKIDPDKALF